MKKKIDNYISKWNLIQKWQVSINYELGGQLFDYKVNYLGEK